MPAGFAAFLERVLPDLAVRERVQKYIGYTLLPDAPHQIAQFWLGKGVLANIVQALHQRVAAVSRIANQPSATALRPQTHPYGGFYFFPYWEVDK